MRVFRLQQDKPVRLIALLTVLSVIVAGLPVIPLSWLAAPVLRIAGWKATELQGHIWHGRGLGLQKDDWILDMVETRLSPARLLYGTPVMVRLSSPGLWVESEIGTGKVREAQVQMQLAQLPVSDMRLYGLQGLITIRLYEVSFDDTGCKAASGFSKTDVLVQNAPILGWQGPVLTGPVTCTDGKLALKLAGKDAGTVINARLLLSASGLYEARIVLTTSDQQLAELLPAFGFINNGGKYSLRETGKLLR